MRGSRLFPVLGRRAGVAVAVSPPAQRAASIGRRQLVAPLGWVAALICVEAALIAPGHLLAGEIADAVLLFLLLQFGPPSVGGSAESRHTRAAIRGLALIPLVRLIALGLPLRDGSEPAGVLVVAVLVGLAALGLAPAVGVTRRKLLTTRLSLSQLSAVPAGIVIGLVAYLLGAPALWSEGAPDHRVVLGLLAAAGAAAVEEIVFRGVVQLTLQRAAGRVGVLAASALFASTYLDANSPALVLALALAGLVFAHAVARTGTLTGPVAGHVLLVLGAGAIWPALLGRVHPRWLSQPGSTIGLAVAVLGMTAILIRRPVMRARQGDPEAEAGVQPN